MKPKNRIRKVQNNIIDALEEIYKKIDQKKLTAIKKENTLLAKKLDKSIEVNEEQIKKKFKELGEEKVVDLLNLNLLY